MSEVYKLFYREHHIGNIIKDGEVFNYEAEANGKKLPAAIFYPLGLFKVTVESHDGPGMMLKTDTTPPSSDMIKSWLESRVVPESRSEIHKVLPELGMNSSSYDMWELNKYTKSMTTDDYYWITDDHEDFSRIHVRHLHDMNDLNQIGRLQEAGMFPL